MVAIARSFGAARLAARSVQSAGMPATRYVSTQGKHLCRGAPLSSISPPLSIH
jgi:hypothetical protein